MTRAAMPDALRVLLVALVAAALPATATAGPPPNFILDNGVIQIGVDIFGALGAEGGTPTGPPEVLGATAGAEGPSIGPGPSTTLVGLRDMATNFESVTYGDPYEGWGVADLIALEGGGATTSAGTGALAGDSGQSRPEKLEHLLGPTPNLVYVDHALLGSGTVKESDGQRLQTVSVLLGTAPDSVPGAVAGDPIVFVLHDFRPSANPRAYEVEVTMSNETPFDIIPRYRRTVDWDIDPTPFTEYLTMHHGPSTAVVASVGNGFNDPNPLVPLEASGDLVAESADLGPGVLCPVDVDFTDCGPGDGGGAFDLDFPVLPPGQRLRFWLYYGAAPSEASALSILAELGATAYSLGQTATDGTPMTFFLGFKAPWAIIDNGTIQLGVGPHGELNVPGGTESAGGGGADLSVGPPPPGTTTVGLRHVPTNWEGVAGGDPAEGWGLANVDKGFEVAGGVRSSMFLPESLGPVLAELGGISPNGLYDVFPVSFDVGGTGTLPESVGDRVRVVSELGSPPWARIVHDFRPSSNPNLYVVSVRLESLISPAFSELLGSGIIPVYRRTIDWDAENTPFDELITLDGSPAGLVGAEAEGFQDPRPLVPLVPPLSAKCPPPFIDCGPADLGIAIDFLFPPLGTGSGYEFFRFFYGAMPFSETDALAAIASVDATAWSLGQTSEGVKAPVAETLGGEGPAMTYIFAFRDVLFEDGFESADTSIWSSAVPPSP